MGIKRLILAGIFLFLALSAAMAAVGGTPSQLHVKFPPASVVRH